MYRRPEAEAGLEVLLVHPGGPYWKNKDIGAWSIPKGEHDEGADPLGAAIREFEEELGICPQGRFAELGEIKQAGGKLVTAFAVEGDFAVADLRSNSFEMEWPPRSGKIQSFPEVDRAAWFTLEEAGAKINPSQAIFLERLEALLMADR